MNCETLCLSHWITRRTVGSSGKSLYACYKAQTMAKACYNSQNLECKHMRSFANANVQTRMACDSESTWRHGQQIMQANPH
jgi:hypothetical protein